MFRNHSTNTSLYHFIFQRLAPFLSLGGKEMFQGRHMNKHPSARIWPRADDGCTNNLLHLEESPPRWFLKNDGKMKPAVQLNGRSGGWAWWVGYERPIVPLQVVSAALLAPLRFAPAPHPDSAPHISLTRRLLCAVAIYVALIWWLWVWSLSFFFSSTDLAKSSRWFSLQILRCVACVLLNNCDLPSHQFDCSKITICCFR